MRRRLLLPLAALWLVRCGTADVVTHNADDDVADIDEHLDSSVTDTGERPDTGLDTNPADSGAPDAALDTTADDTRVEDTALDTGPAPTDTWEDDTTPTDTALVDTTDTTSDTGPDPLVCPVTPDCAPAHELPIPTHWSASSNDVVFGASDDAALDRDPGLNPATYVAGECYPIYRGALPSSGHYLADRYTTHPVDDERAQIWASSVCAAAGVSVRHVRPAESGRPAGLQDNACEVQIVHALQEDGALFTLLLPPGWSASDPPGTHPLVVEGFYDLHDTVFSDTTALLAEEVAASGRDGRGVIGVLWNGGGAIGSASMNPAFDRQFANIIARVAREYGGAPEWIVTYGGSRGGISSLRAAVNPTSAPYRVVFAIAVAPPTRYGEHMELTSATFPGLYWHRGWTLGLTDAWMDAFTYPACAGNPGLSGRSGLDAHLEVLTGTTDPREADSASLDTESALIDLSAQGTQLYLEVTEHDNIVPYAHQVQFAADVLERGLQADVRVMLQTGHQVSVDPRTGLPEYSASLRAAIRTLAAPTFDLSGPVPPFVASGVSYWAPDDEGTGHHQVHPASYPMSVDLPYRAHTGTTIPIVFTGAPGTHYSLWVQNPAGETAVLFSDTIPSDAWYDVQWHPIPEGFEGTYEWWLEYTPPGAGTITAPRTATPTGGTCTTEVIARQQPMRHDGLGGTLAPPTRAAFPSTSWGLSAW